MNKKGFLLVCVMTIVSKCFAQEVLPLVEQTTLSIIFSTKVDHVDIGTDDIAYDVIDNIVKLKVIAPFSGRSSLMVLCGGRMYSYLLENVKRDGLISYDARSDIYVQVEVPESSGIGNSGQSMEEQVKRVMSSDIDDGKKYYRYGDIEGKVMVTLRNVKVSNDYYYVFIDIQNDSRVSYQVEYQGFWNKDVESYKKKAVQENPVNITYSFFKRGDTYDQVSNPIVVDSHETEHLVYVLGKFNTSKYKIINFQLRESEAERDINFRIPMKLFTSADPI